MDDSQGFDPALTREVAMKQQAKGGAMTEAMDEHIERAAKDAGCRVFDVPTIRKLAILDHQDADTLLARSILAHARTIAEAEARIKQLEDECFRLAAGVCINPGQHGLVGDERGNGVCTAYEALLAEERAHSERIAEAEAREAAAEHCRDA